MALYHRHCCWLLFFVIFICLLLSHECNHLLRLMILLGLLCWTIILSLYISFFLLSQCHLFIVTIVDCYIFYFLFASYALLGIADFIGSTLVSNNIIAIYHHCLSPITMALFHCHRCWSLYYVVLFFPPHVWLRPIVGIAD